MFSRRAGDQSFRLRRMHEGLSATGREFGLDVVGEESAGFVILLQHGVKMGKRESPDAQVGLFAGAEFDNRTHFLLQVIQFRSPRRRGADGFVQLLDLSMKCMWSARRRITMRFVAGILSKISYMPSSGRQTSLSATSMRVGTSRPQLNASFAGRIPGLGFELPPGASATTARI